MWRDIVSFARFSCRRRNEINFPEESTGPNSSVCVFTVKRKNILKWHSTHHKLTRRSETEGRERIYPFLSLNTAGAGGGEAKELVWTRTYVNRAETRWPRLRYRSYLDTTKECFNTHNLFWYLLGFCVRFFSGHSWVAYCYC